MPAFTDIRYRLYRMRLGTGALLSLPLVLVLVWYAWAAFAQLDRYRRASEDPEPIDLALFHIAFHDELVRDLRRMTLPPPVDSGLPTYDLSLPRDALDGLYQQLYDDGDDRDYEDGYVRKDGVIHDIRVRFRGSKPWHWLSTQKSMKLRLDKGNLIDGTRTFNLVNDPTPFGLEDQIILDLSRDLDLLTPEYHAARFRLNNNDLGVYRYAAQPTEGLLRRGQRVPGNLYSGDAESLPPEPGVGALFSSLDGWQQVAARAGEDPEDDTEFEPLERLLAAVHSGSFEHFDDYARREIDLDRYATFDALDVAFGGDEHDYLTNHKLFYDPYRGLFEPVAWSFRGFQHEPWFNLVDHPLLVRLKMTPDYLVRRNRALFGLLTGPASAPQVRALADRLFEHMETDLAIDPYWDAYKLLPRVSRFHRFMVRPMSTAKWALAARAEMHSYGRRVRFLLDALERPGVTVQAWRGEAGVHHVALVADGHSGQRLRQVAVSGPCAGRAAWHADVDGNGRRGPGDPLVAAGVVGDLADVTGFADLTPGLALHLRDDRKPKRGDLRVLPEARTYPYLVSAPCAPSGLTLVLDDRITGRQTRLRVPVNGRPPDDDGGADLPQATAVPQFVDGQRSPHIWTYPQRPVQERVVLGPGTVPVEQTRVFAAHQAVTVVAGTQLQVADGASLIFYGPLTVAGSAHQPVVIAARDPERPFGGIALQGPGTAGSRLEHLRVEGGTRVGNGDVGGVIYPSLLNIYDTRDITLSAVRFRHIEAAEDVIHATYVSDLRLHEIEVRGAPTDGVDLEFTDGEVRGLRVIGAGDDCLDLMGADLRVADSVLLSCTNNAVSAGEETDVSAHGLLIGTSDTGVLAKSTSRARLSRSLIFAAGTALDVRGRDDHYQGLSSIGASDLFAVDCERTIQRDADSRLEVSRIQRSLPGPGALEHLARHVLGLSTWSELPAYVADLHKEAQSDEPL